MLRHGLSLCREWLQLQRAGAIGVLIGASPTPEIQLGYPPNVSHPLVCSFQLAL
jgi:hypothetical protein